MCWLCVWDFVLGWVFLVGLVGLPFVGLGCCYCLFEVCFDVLILFCGFCGLFCVLVFYCCGGGFGLS